MIIVKIDNNTLFSFLIYNKPFKYDDCITLYPVTMNDIILFQLLSNSITVKKNSTFRDKKIIKMNYLDFLIYCLGNKELEKEYQIKDLSYFFLYAKQLLELCCKECNVILDQQSGKIIINSEVITPQIFDDLRRIIIIQNGIDFDIDEFLNYDTEQRLLKAEKILNKNNEKSDIEDYIDSLVIALGITEETIMNMSIRKFWRYIKRLQLHEDYVISKTGECSGMVKFKEPIKYWMTSYDIDDKYKNLKTDENALRSKIS